MTYAANLKLRRILQISVFRKPLSATYRFENTLDVELREVAAVTLEDD